MSVTISNCDEICNSPTNISKAKMLYTFSREGRFNRRRVIMCDKFYDLKEVSTARTTGFGFGGKYDFTKNAPHSPPPNTYEVKSDFDKNEKKGFGFGFGRNDMEFTGPLAVSKRNKNPGPGAYDQKSTIDPSLSFSLRGKNHQDNQQKIKVPGPGSYPATFNINQKGSYFLSKYQSSCTRNFNSSVERSKLPVSKVPGPGAYDTEKIDFSPNGKYFWSKYSSSSVRRFGESHRSHANLKSDSPGPGQYKLPSQFGHYVSKNAQEKPKTQQVGRKYDNSDKENVKQNPIS